jgi:uncharacterized membrane protein
MVVSYWLHVLSVVLWIGGMLFAHQILRPVAASLLPPEMRLPLWNGVFARFFPWVWVAIFLLFASGTHLIFLRGGLAHAGTHVQVMALIALLMTGIFAFIFFGPYARLQRHCTAAEWADAAIALARIRRLVGINLLLGLVTVTVATAGRI